MAVSYAQEPLNILCANIRRSKLILCHNAEDLGWEGCQDCLSLGSDAPASTPSLVGSSPSHSPSASDMNHHRFCHFQTASRGGQLKSWSAICGLYNTTIEGYKSGGNVCQYPKCGSPAGSKAIFPRLCISVPQLGDETAEDALLFSFPWTSSLTAWHSNPGGSAPHLIIGHS